MAIYISENTANKMAEKCFEIFSIPYMDRDNALGLYAFFDASKYTFTMKNRVVITTPLSTWRNWLGGSSFPYAMKHLGMDCFPANHYWPR